MDGERDATATVVGFARTLRAAGGPADPERVQAMLAALDHLDVLDPVHVYWAGRLTLCADPGDLPRYDRCFAAYFSGATARPGRRPRPPSSCTAPPCPAPGPRTRTATVRRGSGRSRPRATRRCCATATSPASAPPSAPRSNG
ncbi:hypothetical protein ACFQHO_36975 [Actinomadura yumaensis]|uniref:hypothetical protein n=1 Tax=Actinomadura TaxID=1988 RepID=UPI001F4F40AC|nr:hypothetical protein [Actinomadura sp. J1-007]